MKNITNTLGRVIVVIAAVALLIGVVGMVAAPGVSELMGSITGTMTSKGDDMLNSIGTPHAQGTPKLETPVVTLAGSTLTIEPVANATTYRVYNGNDLLVETDETTVDLATYLPNVGNYSIRVMAMAAGYKDSGNAQVDYIKQLVPGLYETGTNYTVLLKDWDTLIDEGAVTVTDNVITAANQYRLVGDLIIVDGITDIGKTFSSNTETTGYILPDTLTSISNEAFRSADLTSIVIPDSVASIGQQAFYDCTELTSVTIGASVTSVGNYAFGMCSELSNITVAPENTAYHSAENCLVQTASKTLVVGCKNSSIPTDGSVTVIGEGAFNGCGIESVTIPNNVTSIGKSAFSVCSKLTDVTIGNGVTSIGANAFSKCTQLSKVVVPGTVQSISDLAFGDCTKLTTAGPIGSGCSYEFGWSNAIPHNAFAGTSLTKITIPDGIISIGKKAFYRCNGLTSVGPVGSGASVEIPNSLTTTNYRAFYECTGLTSVVLPENVASIGEETFMNCSNIEKLVISGEDALVNKDALKGLTKLTTAGPIGSGCSYEFGWTTNLTAYTFYNCTKLTSIVLPANLVSLDAYIFSNCTNLTTITFAGTMAQWNDVSKGTNWNGNAPATEVVCTDGSVSLQ